MDSWSQGWGPFNALAMLGWLTLIVLVVGIVKWLTGPIDARERSLDILRERYANGDLAGGPSEPGGRDLRA